MPPAPLWRAALFGPIYVLALLSPCHGAAPAAERSERVLERVRRGVVTVVTYGDAGRPLLRGSGFFVARGRVVTSLHVLGGARSARVQTHDGKTHDVARVAAASRARDLALLEVSSDAEAYTPLEVEPEPTRGGEEVTVVGSAAGAHTHATRGATLGHWFLEGAGELLQITARIACGNSGGPVVNRQGKVVGVAALFADSAADLNFAVTSDAVLLLLSQPDPPRHPSTGRT